MAKKKSFSISNALSAGLEETIGAAHGYSGELQVDVIPLRKIDLDPDNPRELALTFADVSQTLQLEDPLYARKSEELASLASLAESIRRQGIIHPVTVYKHGEGYRLIAGERRTLASWLAGKGDIQARILSEKPDPLKVSLLQWIENVERSDLSLWERLRNLKKIVEAAQAVRGETGQPVTVTGLSQLIGCSKPQAMLYKAVLEADEDLMSLIRKQQIRSLEKAAFLAGVEDSEIRTQLTHAVIEGLPLHKLKGRVKQYATDRQAVAHRERRGRIPLVIQLGSTRNMKVARVLLDSLLAHSNIRNLLDDVQTMDLRDPKIMAHAFKLLIKKLEEAHA